MKQPQQGVAYQYGSNSTQLAPAPSTKPWASLPFWSSRPVVNPVPKLTVLLQDDPVDAWQSVDDLVVQRRNIMAIKAIREIESCSLQRAIDLFAERAEFLRQTRPSDFAVRPDEHGTMSRPESLAE
ncbi:hypothetical protein [Micromonospora sp. WMMD964]|uniref:hypothetical protein n=1 Tax=Micromonospora sp. WMMD964 TaxID=3016091 RepID=UPI00249CDC5B|nr:hypothetical protein [Micromonospora sp. WMMD964]WFE98722.1 hypothetical protein O7616_17595 [Micromonospora sp. WMMD964]